MKLNEGWKEGAIGVPGGSEKHKVIRFYVKAEEIKSEFGIDGGKITGLILNTETETLAYYAGEDGWVIKPETEEAEIALAILLLDKN